ncbi:MAG TPA: tetratricopeptide repeat protein [Candidatus Udaeobacter sp.]|nr:tetratricopeptide repeat protein [Candidatus Udaeobacter sp.]
MKIDNFFAELKRRNVYKVAVAYAVVAWLLIQAASILFPTFDAPAWVMKVFVVVIVLCFPVALVFSWAFEITPEGIKRESEIGPGKSSNRRTGRRIVSVTVVLAVIAAALFIFQLVRSKVLTTTTRSVASIASTVSAKSVAVLPLVNTSGDPSNEYFSDGLSEELIAVLAKIPDLKVIGRSSSFLFKGTSGDSGAIGQKLGVAHLIEGSVRKQGDRVRIVAELINAADGRSIWSETYDRELRDVFAVQEEIAKAVAEQMKVRLLGEKAHSDAVPSNQNPAAHNAVLQSDFYFQQQTAESIRKAISFAQEAVRLDPTYALAYAKLSQAWRQYAASFAIDDASKGYDEARQAADKAVSLAPDLPEVRMTVGLLAMNPGLDFAGGEKDFRRVLQSSPNNAAAKNGLCLSLLAQGRFTEAEEACRQALLLDPLLTNLWFNLGRITVGTGRYKEAEEAFRKGLELQPNASRFHTYLATLDILQNRPAQAIANAQLENEGFWRDYSVALVQQAQGDRSAADTALKNFIAKDSIGGAFQVAVLYAIRKESDQTFKWLDTAYDTRDSGLTQLAVTPFFLPYRDDPRFMALCQKLKVHLPSPSTKP